MATNLWDLAKSALTEQVVGKLAGSIGASESQTKSAVDLAIPAILGGLMKSASSPQAAQGLFNELKGMDLGFLNNLGSMLGGGQQGGGGLGAMGLKLLPMLFGSNADSIFGSLAKLSGLGSGSIKTLISMLAPLVMGLIGKQVKSGGLDLKGMTDLIMGQKNFVAKSLPGDLAQQLGVANLLQQGNQAVQGAGKYAAQAAKETASAGSSFLKWLVPLLLAAVGLFLVWKFVLSKPATDVVNRAQETVGKAAESVTSAFDLAGISKSMTTSFGGLTTALGAVTDEASAQAVLPQFGQLEKALTDLKWESLSAANKSSLTGLLKPLIDGLKGAVDKLMSNAAVKSVLEPAYNSLMSKVSQMMQ